MQQLREAIKKQYGSQRAYCKAKGISEHNFNKRMAVAENKLQWLKVHCEDVGLKVEIK